MTELEQDTTIYKALAINGSDSGGGAGIQADIKTFAALRVYGSTAITAITAQNTHGIYGIQEIDPGVVTLQIDAVLGDIEAGAVKTGMLYSIPIIEAVADCLRGHKVKNLVVDPVMVNKEGNQILRPDAVATMKSCLLDQALALTPNMHEAAVLTGRSVPENMDQMKDLAQAVYDLGVANVLIKGGRLNDSADDLLYDGTDFAIFEAERIQTKNDHGAGNTLSAAIAAELAKGCGLYEAIENAKTYLDEAMRYSYTIGSGPHNPVNHFWQLWA